jgi:hypothetical protein
MDLVADKDDGVVAGDPAKVVDEAAAEIEDVHDLDHQAGLVGDELEVLLDLLVRDLERSNDAVVPQAVATLAHRSQAPLLLLQHLRRSAQSTNTHKKE